VREADNLAKLMCRMSWKSGRLNLLEPSGPHRACYGTALTLTRLISKRILVELLGIREESVVLYLRDMNPLA
jgi:hypothetical protein